MPWLKNGTFLMDDGDPEPYTTRAKKDLKKKATLKKTKTQGKTENKSKKKK